MAPRSMTEPGHQARTRRGQRPVHRDLGLGLASTRAAVLLATGVTNRRPPMDEALHDDALARGLIRYCPICDGYRGHRQESRRDRQRQPRRRRGLVPPQLYRRRHPDRAGQGAEAQAPRTRQKLKDAGHRMRRRPGAGGGDLRASSSSSTPPRAITPSTASIRRSAPTPTPSWPKCSARASARTAASRSTATSEPACRASMPPATSCIGLDQISHAMGEGGVAATTIRNDLCAKDRAGASRPSDGGSRKRR